MPAYKVHNLDNVMKKYSSVLPGKMMSTTTKAMKKAVSYVHSTVPEYPPPPPASTYRRTGQLGRANTTDVRSLGSKVVGTIGNNTVYAPWVISSEEVGGRGPQAKAHRNRWYTLQDVVLKARQKVIDIFDSVFRAEIK